MSGIHDGGYNGNLNGLKRYWDHCWKMNDTNLNGENFYTYLRDLTEPNFGLTKVLLR